MPGNEVVLVLDNSGSMGSPWEFSSGGRTKMMKPSDPDRAAILGAMVLEALVRGSGDRLSVISFTKAEMAAPPILKTGEQIQALRYDTGTFYRLPLQDARQILGGAPKTDGRVLIFFTDGIPNDTRLSPDELPKLSGLDSDPGMRSFVLGLSSGGSGDALDEAFQRQARSYLGRLVRAPEDLEFLLSAQQVVPAFTRGYAKALGSKPDVGVLRPGQSKSIAVGKYVGEVLVVTAEKEPGNGYTAAVKGPGGALPGRGGDNGCVSGCSVPKRHFQVFRAANDETKASTWQLDIPGGQGEIEYGIILRYDLGAELHMKPEGTAGEQIPLEAELTFQGKVFDDEDFFKADQFAASVEINGTKIPLVNAGHGKFTGTFVPGPDTIGSTLTARVTFRNTWLERTADATIKVSGLLDLTLKPTPNPIELGQWKGERSKTSRCTAVSLAGSKNAERVEVTCALAGPSGFGTVDGSCLPVPGSEATLPSGLGRPMQYEVCVEAPRCPDLCLSDPSKPAMTVTFAGKDPRYASGAVKVPVYYRVEKLGWLACYWPFLALGGLILSGLWFIAGWVRPHNFEHGLSVRVAGSEAGLKRTAALVLREMPGGVRGFYRNARASLNASGDFVKQARQAVVVVEAGPGGTTAFTKATGLERKDRRTGQWEPLPAAEMSQGLAPGVIYRVGSLYLKCE
jgi:hypothetical protein